MSNTFSFEEASQPAPAAGGGDQAPKAFSFEEASGKPAPKGFMGHARDLGISALQGAIGVPEAAAGLADIPTGGAVGKALENEGGAFGFRPKQAREYLDTLKTDGTQQQKREFEQADGVIGKTAYALQNPSLVANAVAESLPMMGAGGVIGRGIVAAAPKVGAGMAAAAGEGITAAGSAAEQIRQETADGTLTPTQAGLAAATGAAVTGFGALGAKLTNRLGIADADTLMVQGAKGLTGEVAQQAAMKSIPRKVIEGAISEGFLEELPQSASEQILQNMALGKDWSEGVDSAVVLGVLSGMAMGGGAAGVQGVMQNPRQEAVPGQAPAEAPAAQPAQPAPAASPGLEMVRQAYSEQLQALQGQEAGEPDVPQSTPPDGRAILDAQAAQAQAERDAAIVASRAVESPDDEILQSIGATAEPPHRAMGIDPAAGPLSTGAAIAVDTGVAGQMQAAAQVVDDKAKNGPGNTPEPAPAAGFSGSTTSPTEGARAINAVQSAVSDAATRAMQAGLSMADGKAAVEQAAQEQITRSTPDLVRQFAEAAAKDSAIMRRAGKGTPEQMDIAMSFAVPENTPQYPKLMRNEGFVSAMKQALREAAAQPAARWDSMFGPEREALANSLGLPPVIARNLPRAGWATLNPDLQARIAKAMAPATPAAAPSIEGADLGNGWAAFSPESGTAGVPRAEMPQIKAEHRGAMVNFMNARGVAHQEETLPASSLKPTQAEFSREKVARAKGFEGGNRAILVSADNHVLDGHHQWMAAREKGEDVRAIRLNAPIRDLIGLAHDFPSSTKAGGAAGPAKSTGTRGRAADAAEDLRAMAQDAGWAERGGLLIRDAAGNATGRTKWLPRAEWFMAGMEADPETLARDIDRFAAGERVPAKSLRTIEGMLDWLDAQRGEPRLDEDASAYDFEAAGLDLDASEEALLIGDIFAEAAPQDEAAVMRALGFTEEEIQDVVGQKADRKGPRGAGQNGAGRAQEAGEVARSDAQPQGEAGSESAPEGLTDGRGERVTAEVAGTLGRGDILRDESGAEYYVWSARFGGAGSIEVVPFKDGKPVVYAGSSIRFALTPAAQEANPERRSDALFLVKRVAIEPALASYTNEDIARQEAAQRAAAAEAERTQREADQKAQADAERDTFTLTGSDRPADVLAAQGQGGLFDAPAEAKPTNLKDGLAKIRKEKAAQAAAESNQEPIKNETRANAGLAAETAPADQEPVKNLADDFMLRPVEIMEHLIATGEIKALYKAAGVKTADAFGGLPLDVQAKAYAKHVQAGGKEAPPATEGYNDRARRQEREARIRRLQEDQTITQANGKPFKTEASAQAFSDDNELGDTHEAVARDGGFVLQKLPPARRPSAIARQEQRRAADPETQRQDAAFARAEKIGPAAEAAVTAYENGDTSIEEFEAALDAADQPAVGNAPSPLEALFSDLNSGSTRKANKAKKAAAKLPQAARIDYVQANFHDILIQMMEAGALEVNGATTLTEDNAPCL